MLVGNNFPTKNGFPSSAKFIKLKKSNLVSLDVHKAVPSCSFCKIVNYF